MGNVYDKPSASPPVCTKTLCGLFIVFFTESISCEKTENEVKTNKRIILWIILFQNLGKFEFRVLLT